MADDQPQLQSARFNVGQKVSIWWAGLRRDMHGNSLLDAWLRMRPPHELGVIDIYVPAGERVPAGVTPQYFRGTESTRVNAYEPAGHDRVAFTTDAGKKFFLPDTCFVYLAPAPDAAPPQPVRVVGRKIVRPPGG